VLETIRAARELGPLRLPPPPDRGNARPRLTPEESRLFDGLRKWRDAQALERGVMPHRVLKNDLLLAFVRAAPRNMEDVSRIEALDAWRAETYGPAVLLEMERLHSG
jgi:ribonuclease D